MPRKKNLVETVAVPISTTPQVQRYLEALVATGLYGKNSSEAAERLVTHEIERLVQEGSLKRQ